VQSRIFTLRNLSGLHARPATVFVQVASSLSSSITVENLDRPGSHANGKSIIEVLTLGTSAGQRIRVTVEGSNEDRDLEQLAAAIDSGLGEGSAQRG
jgi:phosphocarrier protein FPr